MSRSWDLGSDLSENLSVSLSGFSPSGQDPNYVYNADQYDTLLQDNGVLADDIGTLTPTIWAALGDANADAFWNDMYTNGILKSAIIAELPGPVSLIFDEGFEGPGYEEAWTVVGGTPDPVSTANVYAGTYSLGMAAFSKLQSPSGLGVSDATIRFTAVVDVAPGNEDSFINFYDSGSARVFRLMIRPNGSLEINNADGTGAYQIGVFTTGVRFFVWLDWDAAALTVNAYYSTTTTKPASPSYTRNVGSSSTIDYFIIGDSVSTTFHGNLDDIQVAGGILGDY